MTSTTSSIVILPTSWLSSSITGAEIKFLCSNNSATSDSSVSNLDSAFSKSFLFLNFGYKKIDNLLVFVDQLRENNIKCELYPSDIKIKKQMDYANQKGIDYVVIVGDEELNKNIFKLKEMSSGKEFSFDLDNIVSELKKLS